MANYDAQFRAAAGKIRALAAAGAAKDDPRMLDAFQEAADALNAQADEAGITFGVDEHGCIYAVDAEGHRIKQ